MKRSAAIDLLFVHLVGSIHGCSISRENSKNMFKEFIGALISLGCLKEEIITSPEYNYLLQYYGDENFNTIFGKDM